MHDAVLTSVRRLTLAMLFLPICLRGQARSLDERAVATWATLLAVHDARGQDTTAIDNALASHIAPLRAAGTRVVGLNRIVARYATIRMLMQSDPDTAVASDAAFALGLAADTSSCVALGTALLRPGVGVAAAWALGELGAQCGGFDPHLARLRNPLVRASLLRVAGKWIPFPDSGVIRAYRRATRVDERWAALYALARARRTSAFPLALLASRDNEPRLRELAARLLSVPGQRPSDSASAVAQLDILLRDRAPHVRIAAARSIATYRSQARVPLRRTWRAERDVNVRVAMAQSIGTVAGEDDDVWMTWWKADTSHMVRRALITSAWPAGAVRSLNVAAGAPLATDPDYRIRIAMLEGAAAQSVDLNARDLLARVSDADPRVRAVAITALGKASPPILDSIGWTAIRDSASHEADVGVRQAALATRLRTAVAADVPSALDAYRRALTDSSDDARATAVSLIAGAWRRDSATFDESLRARLRAQEAPPDPLLRLRARAVTPLSHWMLAPSAPLAAPSEYTRIVRDVVLPSLAGRPPTLIVSTVRGLVRIVLDGVQAPMTVDHLSRLAAGAYFRDLRFHRVVPAFVAQGGDPRGDGSGGPGYAIRDELNRAAYSRGAVGMALSGPDTGGSQFFLTLAPQPHLDGHYTVFGRVSSGAAVMDALVQGDLIRNIKRVPE